MRIHPVFPPLRLFKVSAAERKGAFRFACQRHALYLISIRSLLGRSLRCRRSSRYADCAQNMRIKIIFHSLLAIACEAWNKFYNRIKNTGVIIDRRPHAEREISFVHNLAQQRFCIGWGVEQEKNTQPTRITHMQIIMKCWRSAVRIPHPYFLVCLYF